MFGLKDSRVAYDTVEKKKKRKLSKTEAVSVNVEGKNNSTATIIKFYYDT